MTNNKRVSIALPKEIEDRIIDLRKTDECCMMSISDIIRMLIKRGLETEART